MIEIITKIIRAIFSVFFIALLIWWFIKQT